MAVPYETSDDELPELRTIIIPYETAEASAPRLLRRSPRKNAGTAGGRKQFEKPTQIVLSATSNQQRLGPAEQSPAKRPPLKTLLQTKVSSSCIDAMPILPRKMAKANLTASAANRKLPDQSQAKMKATENNSLLNTFSKLVIQDNDSETEELNKRRTKPTESRIAKAGSARANTENKTKVQRTRATRNASQFVLDEARCEEDLVDSDAQDEGEDEDTDLSGFIVDDDAEISFDGLSEDLDSEKEERSRKKAAKRETASQKPKRRLQRGRRRVDDSEDDAGDGDQLSKAFDDLKLNESFGQHRSNEDVEVIDLVSPQPKPQIHNVQRNLFGSSNITLFDKLKEFKLSPPRSKWSIEIPRTIPKQMPSKKESELAEDSGQPVFEREDRFNTPPTTPPQSPSKLKSPSKLLSPSKRGDMIQRSPHRQSMDAFWDLNEVNEWNDQFSPKKVPTASPRKNRLAAFDLWSDAEEDSFEGMSETSDSLPSPCESPSKSKSRPQSPVKAEKQRLLAEKKAKEAAKKLFEESKVQMAIDLLNALDKNITDSQISKLSASTGGVQIVWSKTLRSTAGRANWRRTATKPTGSPVKGKAEESLSGVIVQHFANIELAAKVIDRHDRLINTLSHEFCHLANFMISGIRDQPHGASFKNWARKVTSWMKSQSEIPEWNTVEVTTKHGYVIEWKYLWVCIGRDQNKAMELLNIDEEDGCGAEYGRHSKSIDTEKQRCGRCKGRLVQVRPKPRASPVKKTTTTRKSPARGRGADKDVAVLERMVEVVELSD